MALKDVKSHGLSIALSVKIAWLLLGASICAYSVRPKVWDSSGPSTGFVPLLMGGLMILCGMAMVVMPARSSTPGAKELWPTPGSALRPLAVLGGLVAMAVAMPWLGFLTSAFMLTLFLVRVVYREPWLRSLLIAVFASGALTLFFDHAFPLSLPRMALGF